MRKATDIYITVSGLRIETLIWGELSPRKPAIIFLHDGLGSARLWRDFPGQLAAATGLPAVAFSRLGYGASDPCELPRAINYMQKEASTLLPALLTTAGIDKYFLFGHSDGGSIALLHAIFSPQPGLMGIVTEAAHVFCEEVTLSSIRIAAKEYKNGDLRAKLAKHHGDNVDCAFFGWSSMWLNPSFADFDFRGALGDVRCPVLALQGADDEYGTQAQLDAIKSIPDANIILLPACGHTPHKEQNAQTLSHAAAFISNIICQSDADQ